MTVPDCLQLNSSKNLKMPLPPHPAIFLSPPALHGESFEPDTLGVGHCPSHTGLSQQGLDLPRGPSPPCTVYLSSRCMSYSLATGDMTNRWNHSLIPSPLTREKRASRLFLSWVPFHPNPAHCIKGLVGSFLCSPLLLRLIHWVSIYLRPPCPK